MKPLSSTTRQQNLVDLAQRRFDVLVIGGGVTGAGVALDAVARGYTVALVEKTDFASGTSSKSTKLVHGGIRYLSNFDFALVYEALVERGLLLQNAPFLVSPIEFILPMYKGDLHPVGMPFTTPRGIGLGLALNIGLTMYDVMAGRRGIKWHRHISRDEVLKQAASMTPENLKEGYTYYDAQTNDARLTMSLLRTAAHYGATITNYTEVTSLLTDDGSIRGATIHDRLSGEDITVSARYVVNATGVYAEQIEAMSGVEPQASVEPSKGTHLVFSRERLKIGDAAIVLPETDDKRILFIVPWESRVVVGTTDTGKGDLDAPVTTEEDIAYLLKHLNHYLTLHLTEDDIISTYAGYRPLVKPRKANAATAKLSRSHEVLQSPSGLVSIVGGKLTTYRRMAQDTVDVLSRRDNTRPVHPTLALPLQGSAGWNNMRYEVEARGLSLGLTAATIKHLAHNFGTNALMVMDMVAQDISLGELLIADLPYIKAEVLYACRYEMAMTPDDMLARRTSIILEDRSRGLDILDEVATMMSQQLGWSSERRAELVEAYQNKIQGQLAAERANPQVQLV